MKLSELATVPVGEVPRREVVRVSEGATLIEVVGLLTARGRGAVVVEDEAGKLVGIFTARDLMLRLAHSDQDWHEKRVGEVMTRDPICVRRRDSIAHALKLMREGGFRHLPETDEAGRPLGVLSIRDLVAYIAEHFPEEFVNLPPDPSRETSKRWGG